MINLVLVTHGRMGEELLKCAEGIVGKQTGAQVVGLECDEGPDALEERLKAAMETSPSEAGTLVLTDMMGGTPCNVALKAFRDPRVHCDVVTGVNLPMLISALTNRHYMPLDQLAQKLVDDAPRNIARPLQKLRGI
jgi:mannose/fructose/sorbose-specific phosphotransferase system IIA component